MVRVNLVCLFGNVGFDFSDASGNHACRFELQLCLRLIGTGSESLETA